MFIIVVRTYHVFVVFFSKYHALGNSYRRLFLRIFVFESNFTLERDIRLLKYPTRTQSVVVKIQNDGGRMSERNKKLIKVE